MNKSVDEPNAFQINNSIQRCLAKAIALHGLGLYIYAGEDLPQAPDALNKEQYKSMLDLLAIIGDKEFEAKIVAQIGDETINDANYKAAFNKLKRKADKVKIEYNTVRPYKTLDYEVYFSAETKATIKAAIAKQIEQEFKYYGYK